jgi:hypothetical protein
MDDFESGCSGDARRPGCNKKLIDSPDGWARSNIYLLEGVKVDYGSLQESVCMYVWKKQQRIKLLHTICDVVASVNPKKAKDSLDSLIEEMFPEQKFEREKAVEKALKIMKEERNKVIAFSPVHRRKPKGLIKRINKVLKRGKH